MQRRVQRKKKSSIGIASLCLEIIQCALPTVSSLADPYALFAQIQGGDEGVSLADPSADAGPDFDDGSRCTDARAQSLEAFIRCCVIAVSADDDDPRAATSLPDDSAEQAGKAPRELLHFSFEGEECFQGSSSVGFVVE